MSRFACIERMLPEDLLVLSEIGFDHGYILLRAARRLPRARIIGVDKQQDAGARFWQRFGHEAGAARIETRHGVGMEPLHGDELHNLILAGLGERLMREILAEDAGRFAQVQQLFCMPLARTGRLREWLLEQGFVLVAEDTAIERGRYYPLSHYRR